MTVPAYFNETQRESTKTAARIAGMNVVKIIAEPVAAALAFGCSAATDDEKNILVYDLGKYTADIPKGLPFLPRFLLILHLKFVISITFRNQVAGL